MLNITFLGQSGWLIESEAAKVVIDPFLTGNPLATLKQEQVEADYILLSHAHGDHIADAEPIAKRCDSTIISNYEIANYYGAKEIKNHPMHIGGHFNFPFGSVRLTPAFHGSSFPDGTYGGMPAGIVLTIDGKNIYHTGDTALFSDMALIGKRQEIDLMLVCIGDNFTMGIEDAIEALDLVKPKQAIPMHYKTFGFIDVNADDFVSKGGARGHNINLVEVGSSITL